jgi:hypothetical protein
MTTGIMPLTFQKWATSQPIGTVCVQVFEVGFLSAALGEPEEAQEVPCV